MLNCSAQGLYKLNIYTYSRHQSKNSKPTNQYMKNLNSQVNLSLLRAQLQIVIVHSSMLSILSTVVL